MSNIEPPTAARNAVKQITPVTITAYIDTMIAWVTVPLRPSQCRQIERLCNGDVLIRDRARVGRTGVPTAYVQQLILQLPTERALLWLQDCEDALWINRVDVSLDLVFPYKIDLAAAYEVMRLYLVKLWHGRQRPGRFNGERGVTRYTSRNKWVRSNLAYYDDKPCRITGEPNCLHADWKMRGITTLERNGLATIPDLLSLDYREFWQRRLRLSTVDLSRLGRLIENYRTGSRRRTDWIVPWQIGRMVRPINKDYRIGYASLRRSGDVHRENTTQDVVDDYHDLIDVRRCLVSLDVSHLLPTADGAPTATPTHYDDMRSRSAQLPPNPLISRESDTANVRPARHSARQSARPSQPTPTPTDTRYDMSEASEAGR